MGRTAKVFMTGRSQVVRLPKEFRFTPNEVRIRKEGNAVILEPLPDDWSWLDAIARPIGDDFLETVAASAGRMPASVLVNDSSRCISMASGTLPFRIKKKFAFASPP